MCAVQDTIGSVPRRCRNQTSRTHSNDKTTAANEDTEEEDFDRELDYDDDDDDDDEEVDDDDKPDNPTDSTVIMGARPSARYAASLQQDLLVAQTWNEVVLRMNSSSKTHKPTKLLGRTSLQSVWRHLEFLPATATTATIATKDAKHDHSDDEETTMFYRFVQSFEELLFADLTTNADARLVWSADGHGRAELARRAADRQQRAAAVLAASEAEAATATATADPVQQSEQDNDERDNPRNDDDDDEEEKEDKEVATNGTRPRVTSAACHKLLEEFEQDHEEPL